MCLGCSWQEADNNRKCGYDLIREKAGAVAVDVGVSASEWRLRKEHLGVSQVQRAKDTDSE